MRAKKADLTQKPSSRRKLPTPPEPVSFPESVRAILTAETPDEDARETLRTLGLPPTVLNAIHLAMSGKAAKGDPSAAKYLRDTVAEQQADEDDEPPVLAGLDFSEMSDSELKELAARISGWDGL